MLLQGKTEVVVMPSDQYSLELTNTTVASLDTPSSNVTGLVVGDTEVVLQDKSILYTFSLDLVDGIVLYIRWSWGKGTQQTFV